VFSINMLAIVNPNDELPSAELSQQQIEALDAIANRVRQAVTNAWSENEDISIWTDKLPQGEAQTPVLGVATHQQTLDEIITSLSTKAMDAWQSGEQISVWTDRRSTNREQSNVWTEPGLVAEEQHNTIQSSITPLTQENADLLSEMISGIRAEATSAWEGGQEIVVFLDRRLSGTDHFIRESAERLEIAGAVGTAEQTELLEHILSNIRSDAITAWRNGEEIVVWTDQHSVE